MNTTNVCLSINEYKKKVSNNEVTLCVPEPNKNKLSNMKLSGFIQVISYFLFFMYFGGKPQNGSTQTGNSTKILKIPMQVVIHAVKITQHLSTHPLKYILCW